jgi:hypothetical protein
MFMKMVEADDKYCTGEGARWWKGGCCEHSGVRAPILPGNCCETEAPTGMSSAASAACCEPDAMPAGCCDAPAANAKSGCCG